MKTEKQLQQFWNKMTFDNRISPAHGLLYIYFCIEWIKGNCLTPVEFTRAEMMKRAKIAGIATYHKCMNELVKFGYIYYEPSFNPEVKSKVRVL